MKHKTIISLVAVLAMAATSQAGLIIFNDTGPTWSGGADGESATVNKIQGNLSGALVDYVTGLATGVSYVGMTGESQGASVPATSHPGNLTDFGQVFNGILNPAGVYYTRNFHFTITGLDPSKLYEIVLAVNRPSSNNWDGKYRIEDVTDFVNTSSAGTTISTVAVANDTTTMKNTNDLLGYVPRFTNISPGADGDFTISMYCVDAAGGGPLPMAYMNGFRLTEVVPEPATMSLLALGAAALLRRRKRQTS